MFFKRSLPVAALCCTSLLCLWCSGLAAASPGVQRWAIVATLDNRDKALADLITARLTDFPQVQLVERESIRKVLDELKLNRSGLVDPSKTARFGALVSADAIVLIEHETKSRPPLFRVRIIETRSGLRRSPDQRGYVITFKVISLNGKPTRDARITTTTHETSEVRRAVQVAVESELGKQEGHSARPDPRAEAEVLGTRRDSPRYREACARCSTAPIC